MNRRNATRVSVYLSLSILAIALLFVHPPGDRPGHVLPSPIELWIGHELEHIANHFINPTLHYSTLTYQSSRTVIVHNLTLTSPDPRNPSQTIDILSVKSARIELAKIPHFGQPLLIKEFYLNSPTLRLIATNPVPSPSTAPATTPSTTPPTTQPQKTRFIGFSDFLTTKQPARGATVRKPSDYFQITTIDIKNGTLLYDARRRPTSNPSSSTTSPPPSTSIRIRPQAPPPRPSPATTKAQAAGTSSTAKPPATLSSPHTCRAAST